MIPALLHTMSKPPNSVFASSNEPIQKHIILIKINTKMFPEYAYTCSFKRILKLQCFSKHTKFKHSHLYSGLKYAYDICFFKYDVIMFFCQEKVFNVENF